MVPNNQSMPQRLTKAETLALLRQRIRHVEGHAPSFDAQVSFNPAGLGDAFEGGFPIKAVHDFIADDLKTYAATCGFISGLSSALVQVNTKHWIVWVVKSKGIYPPGLVEFGIDPSKIVFIELPKDKQILWAVEEALRCSALAAVIAEVDDIDLTATRRLQLAVEASGTTGFIIRTKPKTHSSASSARWHISPAPSVTPDGLPGMGFPRWHVHLERARNGLPKKWLLEWRSGTLQRVSDFVASPNAVQTISLAS